MRRILVVDDEQAVLNAAKRILAAEGFEVLCSLDAEAALVLMEIETETARPDIALVDLKLPGMSGLDFVDATRSAYPNLVVIVTTGVSSADQAIATLNHDAFDFLPKPFTFEELLSPIYRASRYIDLNQAAGAETDGADPEAPELAAGDRFPGGYLFLGLQVWAKPEDDETVRVGVSDLFEKTAGNVKTVDLPQPDDQIHQGGPLARISTVDGRSHVVLAPISGIIVEVNGELSDNPLLVNQDATGKGWLTLVRPGGLRHELGNLRRL